MFSQIYANTHGYPYALAEVKIYYLNTVNSESKWRRNQNTNNDFTHRQSPPQSVLLTHVNARTQPVQYMYIMTQESKNKQVRTNKKKQLKSVFRARRCVDTQTVVWSLGFVFHDSKLSNVHFTYAHTLIFGESIFQWYCSEDCLFHCL